MMDPINFENEESLDLEFDQQMQALVNEAQTPSDKPTNPTAETTPEIERLMRQNAELLARLEEAVREQGKGLQQKSALNQQLFDALHAEMKGYRDNMFLEVSQRPLIMDVIGVYDDLRRIFEQIEEAEHERSSLATAKVSTDHLLYHLLEVLERVGVTKRDSLTGKYDINCHRAVSRVEASAPEEDGKVERSLRPGFQWRGSVLRPEEVVVKKWGETAISEPAGQTQRLRLEREES